MEETQMEKLLREVQDRVGDAMAAIQLLTPLIEEKGSGKDREYLAALNKSFYRLLRMIHNGEASSLEAIPENRGAAIDLAGLCRDVGTDCMALAEKLGVKFTWSISDSSVISWGCSYYLELAILNLLANAFEAAGPGGTVTLKGVREENRWLVIVEDDGPGLRPREPKGDPFLKVPGGIGLGLEAVRRVAELHGGTLAQSTGSGAGVKAVLSLPLKPVTGLLEEPSTAIIEKPWGGFSSALVELSHLLPAECFSIEDTE